MRKYILLVAATAMVLAYRRRGNEWPLVRRSTLNEALREQRSRLIDHLRANSRGITLLDHVMVSNCEIHTPGFTVLGQYNTITGCRMIQDSVEAE